MRPCRPTRKRAAQLAIPETVKGHRPFLALAYASEVAHVLFVCVHNAGRSQMSQALFERVAEGRHTAASAGTAPAGHVHPEVVEVMREIGVDLSRKVPQRLTTDLAESADVVVTMGCGDACPHIPGKRYLDWELADPEGKPRNEVRALREEIMRRVEALARDLADPS
jgi:arsenate reductase